MSTIVPGQYEKLFESVAGLFHMACFFIFKPTIFELVVIYKILFVW
jgi:hypothetical protein